MKNLHSFYEYKMEQEKAGRSHKRWSEDEVNSLILELTDKLPKEEIAKRHQRSHKSIDSRIFSIIYQKHIEGLSNFEIEKNNWYFR